jgi:outer membrane protein OmpA-like peptidoglycan-associated protein
MRYLTPFLVIALLFPAYAMTQQPAKPKTPKPKAQNLVVNPGFEQLKPGIAAITESGSINSVVGWSSPNLGEPEVFGSNSTGNVYDSYGDSWNFKAKGGKMVGAINVLETREYLQGTLSQPLTVGKKYHFWFYVHYHCSGANNIGIAFLPSPANLKSDGVLKLTPVAVQKEVAEYSKTEIWALVRDSFIAYQPYQNFIIGNFSSDSETKTKGGINHFFAYVDDIAVVESFDQTTPMPGTVSKEKEAEKWTKNAAKVEAMTKNPSAVIDEKNEGAVTLSNLEFKANSAELLPASLDEIDNIVAQMKRKATLKIEITGHTSSEGEADFNQKLSEQRAKTVRNELLKRGIPAERVIAQGKGESEPLVPETDEASRAKNRRVEFKVIQ